MKQILLMFWRDTRLFRSSGDPPFYCLVKQDLRHAIEIGGYDMRPVEGIVAHQKLKSHRIWATIFRKWSKFTLKNQNEKNKVKYSEARFPAFPRIGGDAYPPPPGGEAPGSTVVTRWPFFLLRTEVVKRGRQEKWTILIIWVSMKNMWTKGLATTDNNVSKFVFNFFIESTSMS